MAKTTKATIEETPAKKAQSLNQVALIGRTGNIPELRFTANGTPVCNLRLAVDGRNGVTTWHTLTLWGKQAQTAATFLTPVGRRIAVTGSLTSHSWEAADGSTRTADGVNVHSFQFLDYPKAAELGEGA